MKEKLLAAVPPRRESVFVEDRRGMPFEKDQSRVPAMKKKKKRPVEDDVGAALTQDEFRSRFDGK